MTFFGFPLWICAAFSATLTLVWWFLWPHDRLERRTGFRYIVLRYGHALTWALLTVAALVAMAGHPPVARGFALAALATYAVFMITVRVPMR